MIDNFLHAYNVVRKLKQRQVSLKYGCLKKPYNLVAFCNASYANLNDGSSQGGLIIFLNGKDGNISLLCWNSKKMKRVCRSTIPAETMALLEASETCFWLSHIINEMLDIPLGITQSGSQVDLYPHLQVFFKLSTVSKPAWIDSIAGDPHHIWLQRSQNVATILPPPLCLPASKDSSYFAQFVWF